MQKVQGSLSVTHTVLIGIPYYVKVTCVCVLILHVWHSALLCFLSELPKVSQKSLIQDYVCANALRRMNLMYQCIVAGELIGVLCGGFSGIPHFPTPPPQQEKKS